jgi:hypothetical protein
MTLHKCPKCDYTSTRTSSIKNHLNRKKPCDSVNILTANIAVFAEKNMKNKKDSIKQYKYLKTAKIAVSKNIKHEIIKKPYTCEYCNRDFTRKYNLTVHLNERCKILKDKNTEKLLLEEVKILKKKLDEIENKPTNITNNNTYEVTNNITNIINIFGHMSKEHVIKTFKEYFKIEDLSEINLADFTFNKFLRYEDMPVYLSKDDSRVKTCYLNENGDEIADPNQEVLIGLIKPGFEDITEKYFIEVKKLNEKILNTKNEKERKEIKRDLNNLNKEYKNVLNIPRKGKKYRKRIAEKCPRTLEEKIKMIGEIKKIMYYYNPETDKITKRIKQKVTEEDVKKYEQEMKEYNDRFIIEEGTDVEISEEENKESEEEESEKEESNEEEKEEKNNYDIEDNNFINKIYNKYGGKYKLALIMARNEYEKSKKLYLNKIFEKSIELKHNAIYFITNGNSGLRNCEKRYYDKM